MKQSLIASYNTLLAPKAKAAFMETRESGAGSYNSEEHRSSDRISMAAWFNQFSILLQRSLKERKHESFNTLRVFQVIMAAVFAGLMWWRSDFRDVQDRLGLLFFMSIFWGVFPSSNSVFVFPQERAIFLKERASGMYSLSSYFTSRIVGDLPMELILPYNISLCDLLDGRVETRTGSFPFVSSGSARLRPRLSGSWPCSRRSHDGRQESFNDSYDHNASICPDRRILRA
ncbi:ABC TRANSPORTER G FAMILY MEMBER 28 [Salix purpurea]|uniref:ABC TRANSPORTER G FAMILY MEMBER 28 n=1 Tax=Salix purpurea TaxID=77065 RepID=A0A9Q0WB65_SALPP|nr:ABC TRANSPORTER G FAMILY MEMBER 28 [Salix purpurea]